MAAADLDVELQVDMAIGRAAVREGLPVEILNTEDSHTLHVQDGE